MTIKHRYELVDLLKHLGLPLIAVECGTAEGNFSKDLLSRGLDKLYSVDVFEHIPNIRGDGNSPNEWHQENYRQTKEKLAQFGEKSVILKGFSHEMAKYVPDNSCGLVYLDGDHSLEGVLLDLRTWYPKLVSGGVMATHDYLSPAYGTKLAFDHFRPLMKDFQVYNIPEDKEEDAGAFFFKP